MTKITAGGCVFFTLRNFFHLNAGTVPVLIRASGYGMSWLLPCFSKKKPEILGKQYPYRDKPAAPASAHGQAQSQEAVFHPEHLDAHSSSPGSQTAENEPGQSLEGKKCSGKRVFPGTGPYKKPPD